MSNDKMKTYLIWEHYRRFITLVLGNMNGNNILVEVMQLKNIVSSSYFVSRVVVIFSFSEKIVHLTPQKFVLSR